MPSTTTLTSDPTLTPPRARALPRPPKKLGVSWGALSATLPTDIRSEVARRFRELGGDFGRWNGQDERLLCDAMTATEDWLELDHPRRDADRAALRKARRSVEGRLYP